VLSSICDSDILENFFGEEDGRENARGAGKNTAGVCNFVPL
jgi:hypothetical protein